MKGLETKLEQLEPEQLTKTELIVIRQALESKLEEKENEVVESVLDKVKWLINPNPVIRENNNHVNIQALGAESFCKYVKENGAEIAENIIDKEE